MDLTIKQLLDKIKVDLKGFYPDVEVESLARILLEAYTGSTRVLLALEPDRVVSKEIIDLIDQALARLEKFEPIQYIIGRTEFCGLTFKVNRSALIPRPETEELVEWISQDVKELRWVKESKELKGSRESELSKESTVGLKILDVGTGSGCIAITLKKLIPGAEVTAIDISKEALQMAIENAELNNVVVDFIGVDIFDRPHINKIGEFDIIVSNPPYVLESQQAEMHTNVLKYEPGNALYVADNDPLRYYKGIVEAAAFLLKPEGMIYFEINEVLGAEMINLLKDSGYTELILKRDIHDKDRMIRGFKTSLSL